MHPFQGGLILGTRGGQCRINCGVGERVGICEEEGAWGEELNSWGLVWKMIKFLFVNFCVYPSQVTKCVHTMRCFWEVWNRADGRFCVLNILGTDFTPNRDEEGEKEPEQEWKDGHLHWILETD